MPLSRLTGVRAAGRNLAREMLWAALDLRGRTRRTVTGTDLKLNLGCGADIRSGWVNVDLTPEADIQIDLREPWPIAEGSAAVAHAEHFFEHLEHPKETGPFLAECLRALRPGGVLSLSVPDTERALRAYVEDPQWLHYAVERWPPGPEVYIATPLAIVNQQFRQGGEHKYSYDADTLIAVLTDAGFTAAAVREPNAWDSPDRVEGSLLVQAVRP